MSLTKNEIQRLIAGDLARKNAREIVWTEITAAFAATNTSERARLIEAIQVRNSTRVGEIVIQVVRRNLATAANTEAAAMLADDNMDLGELQRWLGPPSPVV